MKIISLLIYFTFSFSVYGASFSPNGKVLYRILEERKDMKIYESCDDYITRNYEAVLSFIGSVKRKEIRENMNDVFKITDKSYYKKMGKEESIKVYRFRVLNEFKESIYLRNYDNSTSHYIFNSKDDCEKYHSKLILNGYSRKR